MFDRIAGRLAIVRACVALAYMTAVVAGAVVRAQAAPQLPDAAAPAPPEAPALPAPTEQPAPEPAAPEAKPQENPGLINELGKLFSHSRSLLPTLKSPAETINDLNARTKDAGESLSRITRSPNVTGRVVCPVSANGAPDCKAGSDKLCQSKGFKEGKSLDTDSAQSCSAESILTGHRSEGACRTNYYVTRAICR
jgi:hypothetical protein